MGTLFDHEKFKMEWFKAIDDAISDENQNSNRPLKILKHAPRFERDGHTISEGLRLNTTIQGTFLEFWIGIEVTPGHENNPDNRYIVLYFYDVEPQLFTKLNSVNFTHSTERKLNTSDIRLELKAAKLTSSDKAATIRNFFDEALNAL